MKQTAIWILRYLLIPVGFIWATGIFGVKVDRGSVDPSMAFTPAELATLRITPDNIVAYSDSLVSLRRKQVKENGVYYPVDYFCDLKQYNMFEIKYGKKYRSIVDAHATYEQFTGPNGFSGKGELVSIRDANWHYVDWDKISINNPEILDIVEARHHWFPKDAEQDAAMDKITMTDTFSQLFDWFSWFYLRGFPFALVLFFIWKIRLKDEILALYWGIEREKPEIDICFTPLSFLVSVLLWPIILAIDIRNSIADSLVKAEVLSRRQSMMTLLSKQELKLIEAGKKMSLKEFRAYLDSVGLRRRHSFALALFVVLFFTSVCKAFSFPSHQLSGFETTTHTVTSSGDTDVGWSYSLLDYLDEYAIFPSVSWTEKVLKFKSIFLLSRIKAVTGFARIIEGVPKVSNQFSF